MRIGPPQGGDQVGEEAADLVVALVEGEPSDGSAALTQQRDPLPKQSALAETRRRRQDHQPCRQGAVQRLQQPAPRHQPVAQDRRAQFRLNKHVSHPIAARLARAEDGVILDGEAPPRKATSDSCSNATSGN